MRSLDKQRAANFLENKILHIKILKILKKSYEFFYLNLANHANFFIEFWYSFEDHKKIFKKLKNVLVINKHE
jgi:hypothetical protein